MKKLLALLLALVTLLSALPLAGAAFKDEGFIAEEYQKAVAAVSEMGIINGFEDGSFGPKKTLTRAQAAKILCVMLEGEKESALTKTETGFSDVPATHWAAKYVAYCVDKGIVAGVGDGKFDPNGQLSAAAFAKMLLVAIGTDGSTFT
ncbi:MAG: S-layer homology domain-containing protein, partial [Oscillospiraceae bacterium]|nr:S-layer homology domain-containing protein [Oscillospiraceae bacterium]